jgi:hypothetical protein
MMCSPFIVIPLPSKDPQSGTARATSGAPQDLRGALKPRAAGAVLLAEVYPSEKYRGEKVRKYNPILLLMKAFSSVVAAVSRARTPFD